MACAALIGACAHLTTPPEQDGTTPSIDAASALQSVASELPETTHTVLVVDVQRFLIAPFQGAYDTVGGSRRFERGALRAFARAHLGVDLARAQRLVVVLSDDALLALVDRQAPVRAVAGSVVAREGGPGALPVFDLPLGQLALAPLEADGWVVVGLPVYIERWAAARRARSDASLAASARASALASMLDAVSAPGAVVVAASALTPERHLARELLPTAWGLVPHTDDLVPASWSGVFGAALTPEALVMVGASDLAMVDALEESARAFRARFELPLPPDAGSPTRSARLVQLGTLSDVYMRAVVETFQPKRDPRRLRMTAPLRASPASAHPAANPLELGRAVADARALSARAVTDEALRNLAQLARSLKAYRATLRHDADGDLVQDFPAPTRSVPAPVVSCCAAHGGPDQDRDGRCDANPEFWDNDATFQALGFKPQGPTRFVYAIDRPHPDSIEAFVRAYGDVDCDGVASEWVVRVHEVEGDALVIEPAAPKDLSEALE